MCWLVSYLLMCGQLQRAVFLFNLLAPALVSLARFDRALEMLHCQDSTTIDSRVLSMVPRPSSIMSLTKFRKTPHHSNVQ